MFLCLFFQSVQYRNNSKMKYEDLIYKEFTIEKITKQDDPEMGATYIITVFEEDKKMIVNNLLTVQSVRAGLDSLKQGDRIDCYLIETSSNYESVEIKSNEMILSLEKYNQIYSSQGLTGMVIMPIAFFVCIAFSIKFLIAYLNERNNQK